MIIWKFLKKLSKMSQINLSKSKMSQKIKKVEDKNCNVYSNKITLK